MSHDTVSDDTGHDRVSPEVLAEEAAARRSDPINGLRLYRVELEQTLYVLAPDAATAEYEAPSYQRHDGGEPLAWATEARQVDRVETAWIDSPPHWEHAGDPPTVREALAIIAAREAKP